MNKTISISCIDTLNYEKSIRAINATCENIKIDKVYWFSDKNISDEINVPVIWHQIPKIDIKNFIHFTGEIHLKIMPEIVDTDFNVINHYDGFAVNKNAWTDDFLTYDYIGAIWPFYPVDANVGNGGFSLRSKKLYDALLDLKVSHLSSDYSMSELGLEKGTHTVRGHNGEWLIPEDVIICKIHRNILQSKYDIKFAPPDIANRWSIEGNMNSEWLGKSLGFHGRHGVARYYGVEI